MIKKIAVLMSLATTLTCSSLVFGGTLANDQEYLKFKSHDRDEISLDNGKRFSYTVVSRSKKGGVETLTARLNDPLQADLENYNNLVITLDNEKKTIQGFAETSDGHFQFNSNATYPVWSKVNKPKQLDSIIPSSSAPATLKKQLKTAAAAPMVAADAPPMAAAAADGEKDANGNYVIDVFMGFSDAAAARINNNLQARAQVEVDMVNTALKNSNIQGVYLRLVGVGTTPNNPGIIWQPENLNPLSQVKVWFKDDIARLQPDLIAIQQVQTGAAGSAGGWAGVGGTSDTQVVDIDLLGAWRHEVGHNVGGVHCKEAGDTGYNYGYSVRQGRGTAMCGNDLAYYSSPLIRDNEGNILGSANDADMARVWRERMAEMAARRIHTVPYSNGGGGGGGLPITLQAEDYVNASDTTPGNQGGAYRQDNVDIQSTTDAGGGFNVGWTAAGEWLTYNINVPSTGNYEVSYRVASPSGGGTIQLEKAGGSPVYGSIQVPATGGWQNWTTVKHTVALTAGAQTLGLAIKSAGFNLNWIQIDKVATGAGTYNIQNRWMADQSINIERGVLESSNVSSSLQSDQWVFERMTGSDFYRIKNRLKPTLVLNIESGKLDATVAGDGWWSAQWTLEQVEGTTDLFRLKNRWQPDQYINVESGSLAAGPIQTGWWSAMWTLNAVK